MGEMVRYGVLPNPHTPGVLVDFYGHPISSGGGAYASLTGPGETATPGDLTQAGGFTVQAPSGDTMGIQLRNASAAATPRGVLIEDSAGAGIEINAEAGGGMQIFSQGGGGLDITDDGGMQITETGGRLAITANGQITLESTAGGGIIISDTSGGGGGLLIQEAGSFELEGGADIYLSAADGLRLAQIATPSDPAAGSDKLYFKSDDNLYALDSGGTEHLIGGASVDTGWIDATPLLVNSWTPQGGDPIRYRKLSGVVYLQLAVAGGGAATVLTLPAGFRPNLNLEFPAQPFNAGIPGPGPGQVLTTGVVQVTNNDGSVPDGAFIMFSYPADA